MKEQVKERALLPVAIPVGIFAFIAAVTFSMSRILLNVPKMIATSVALMVAVNILIVAGYLSSRSKITRTELLPMAAVAVVPIIAGLAVAGGFLKIKGADEKPGTEVAVVKISAQNLAFDTQALTVPAGQPFKLTFDNKDKVPHNVWIKRDKDSADSFFKPAFFSGPASKTWEVPAIPAGTYYFQCEIHPTMNGTVEARSEAVASKPEGPAQTVEITAKNSAFDKTTLQIPADRPFKLDFNNVDPQPHNVTILRSQGSSEALFKEKFIIGPTNVTWNVPAIPAGTYFFQCDVHPTVMKGQVIAG